MNYEEFALRSFYRESAFGSDAGLAGQGGFPE